MNYYNNYSDYAIDFCLLNGIKVHTVDNKNYIQLPNRATVYINRIGGKTKIVEDTTKFRNLIAISVDTDRHNLSYIKHFIKSHTPVIDRNLRLGSCQKAIRCSLMRQLLAGCFSARGANQPSLLAQKIG